MDCHEFDGQVVRLERLKDIADKFVRVRLTRIDNADLNLFEFDYDLTMMIFFLNAEEQVYARYGGRDAASADSRQSLAGLHYTMQSVLQMHEREEKAFAPKSQETPKYFRNSAGARGSCQHCHRVKEIFNADLRSAGKWTPDMIWRYPLPENAGLLLEVDRGNVIKEVKEKSPAAAAGLKTGDMLRRLNGVPVHSFGDAQYALDRAPKAGSIEVVWQRDDKVLQDKLTLPDGWRRGDLSWRTSMRHLVPSARVYGDDLTAEEKKALGLSEKQLAFRQKTTLTNQARAAGVQGGDIIFGVDGRLLEMDVTAFQYYIKSNYLIGEKATLNIIRDGKRMDLPMTFVR